MLLQIDPIQTQAGFGARVTGVDLTQELDSSVVSALQAALDRYAVLVFPGQHKLDAQTQTSFGAHFGPLDRSYLTTMRKDLARPTSHVSYGEVSNIDAEGKIWDGNSRRRLFFLANQLWHSDTSYKAVPTKVTLLWAKEVTPDGGETEFADMRAAWDDLPSDIKEKLRGKSASHSLFYARGLVGFDDFSDEERSAFPPVPHPLVRQHPGSGRTSLYLASYAEHIIGMAKEEGQELLEYLTEHATQPKYILSHTWSPGDLVIWDNGGTMHRGRPYDEFKHRRVLHRTSANELAAPVPA